MAHEGHDHDHGEGHAHDHAHPHAERGSGVPLGQDAESAASFGAPVVEAVTPLAVRGLSGVKALLHVDPIAGAAGDMLVGALIDLGADRKAAQEAIDALGLAGARVMVERRDKHAIAALGIDVQCDTEQPPRDYATIKSLLERAELTTRTKQLAQLAFRRLGEAEAKIHRTPLPEVHFHEVGSVDAIVDIVASCALLASVEASAGGIGALGISIGVIPLGAGRARGAHGSIPVPAPAALELLTGLPVRDAGFLPGEERELVTPTGAALLRAWAEALPCQLGGWPAMTPEKAGYGAGTRDLRDRPNVVRLVLGRPSTAPLPVATHVVIEANVDDASAEVIGATMEALFDAGALDAFAQPLTMKKSRPATLLSAIATQERADDVARALLAHSGSLGVRRTLVSRIERPRRFVDVETAYGSVRVKIADGDGLPIVVHPEMEDCRARAASAGVPVREVIRAAIAAVA